MQQSELTPLKLVPMHASGLDTEPLLYYKINDIQVCKPVGDFIIQMFPQAATEGVNPITLWMCLYDEGEDDHEIGHQILGTFSIEEARFIADFLETHEGGKYALHDLSWSDDRWGDWFDDDEEDLDECDVVGGSENLDAIDSTETTNEGDING